MRVLHLIKSLGRGGAEVLLAEGLSVADRDRFDFEFGYFLPWKNALVPALQQQGATVTCFQTKSSLAMLASTRRVAKHLRENQIDLIHAHLPLAGVVARRAGKLAGVPVVYTEHNLQERYHRLTRWLNMKTWRRQAEAIAVSGDVADSIRRHAGDSIPLHTVLNGVNVRSFDPAGYDGADVRRDLGIPEGSPIVGTVAVFRLQKRLDDWLRVARQVADTIPETHFLLVGDGPEREHVEATVAQHNLAENVHLVGLQEETRPYFAAMDVYLMTSEFEGLPIALLEAMAMKVPPVVTSVGGIPELVNSGVNGYLQPYGAVAELGHSVLTLLQDPARRAKIGSAARESVVAAFSMERMQRELEDIYHRVLSERNRQQTKLGAT